MNYEKKLLDLINPAYTVETKEKISKEKVIKFENDNNITLPLDFKEYIINFNGFRVIDYKYKYILADFFSLKEIEEKIKHNKKEKILIENIIPICKFGDEGIVVLKIDDNESSIYASSEIGLDNFLYMGNFPVFFENSVASDFYPYWDIVYEAKRYDFTQ
ncbi:hypothetical protein OKW22_000558 [Bacilli bacterium PM5-3]|nr:hypothetical protein [Bacilli bacterium PM5-3]